MSKDQPTPTDKADQAATVKARVLINGSFGAVNAVVSVTEAEAKAAAGELDTTPAAVAYAEKLAAAAAPAAALT